MEIQPLQDHHDTSAFSCGEDALDTWLRQTASQHARKGISRTFIAVTPEAPQAILGFYSLTVGEAPSEVFPAALAKKLPRKVPIVVLGRLGVAAEHHGKGIGSFLLMDALYRVVQIANQAGVNAILVDAKGERAEQFYRHFGFLPLPDTPQRLVMPVKTAANLFEG